MNKLLNKRKDSGFTIIEVMIVLAIAGLIMVIVFIAIPQLQRNQRDNARQNVTNRVESEMETYAGNNNGSYPLGSGFFGFYGNYFNKISKQNPKTGVDYTLAIATSYTQNPTENQILAYRDAACNGENAAAITGGSISNTNTRSIALRVQLDNGSTYYCVDNG